MSRTDDSLVERRDQVSPEMRTAAGAIRRFSLGVTSGVQWKVIGHRLLDGTDEVRPSEVFSNIGFYSRPKEGNNAEAIAVFVAGAQNPIVIATRDEDARRVVAQLGADQTAMWNSTTVILITGNTVEIKLAGGVATKLPTLADYEALRAAFNAHVHATAGTGVPSPPTAVPSVIPVATPTGTAVLKAQ